MSITISDVALSTSIKAQRIRFLLQSRIVFCFNLGWTLGHHGWLGCRAHKRHGIQVCFYLNYFGLARVKVKICCRGGATKNRRRREEQPVRLRKFSLQYVNWNLLNRPLFPKLMKVYQFQKQRKAQRAQLAELNIIMHKLNVLLLVSVIFSIILLVFVKRELTEKTITLNFNKISE